MRLKPTDTLIFYCNDSYDRDFIWKLQGKASEAGIMFYTVPAKGLASIQIQRPPNNFGPHYQLGPKTIRWLNLSLNLLIGKKNVRQSRQKLDEIARDRKLQPEPFSSAGAVL